MVYSKERFAQAAITRGLEQQTNEQALLALYEKYCREGDEKYLSDIILYAERIGRWIAFNRLADNTHFCADDFEDYLQELSTVLTLQLRRERAKGRRQRNIVWTVRSLYGKRSVDFFRKLKRRNEAPTIVSLDAINETQDGKTREIVGGEGGMPWYDPEDIQERADLLNTLYRLYLCNMLNYDGAPQKALSLCYARVLYHLELRYDPEQMEEAVTIRSQRNKNVTLDDPEKQIAAIQAAQNPATATSAKWAIRRMEGKTIRDLAVEAQASIQNCFDPTLAWGNAFCSKLCKPSDYTNKTPWGSLVFTSVFSEKKLSSWDEAMHHFLTNAVCSQISDDPYLREAIRRYGSPIAAWNVSQQGRNNHAPDER